MLHELMHWINDAPTGKGHATPINRAIYVRCFSTNPRWNRENQEPLTTQDSPTGTITPRPLPIPPIAPGGGDGGLPGGPGWGYGGYRPGMRELQEFLDWLYSIEAGEGTVTVDACVGTDCNR